MVSTMTCVRPWSLNVVMAPGCPFGLLSGGAAVKVWGTLRSVAETNNPV